MDTAAIGSCRSGSSAEQPEGTACPESEATVFAVAAAEQAAVGSRFRRSVVHCSRPES